MTRAFAVFVLGVAATTLSIFACGGHVEVAASEAAPDAGSRPPGSPTADEDRPLVPASKVDVLFVVDNSSGMAAKAERLARSAGTLVRAAARTGDVHVGVIATSLGAMGGDTCTDENDQNTRAYLQRKDPQGKVVPSARTGVLTLQGDVDALVNDTATLIRGVGDRGCGAEAQLESTYRFLVQPDPWVRVGLTGSNQADLGLDVDARVLEERAAFLRPDSALVVVLLTDEDDSASDPRSVGGQGWAFAARHFPGSRTYRSDPSSGTTAPRASTMCKSNPNEPTCTSCGFRLLCDDDDPACAALRADPECSVNGGYYGPREDPLGVRFHRMKERFGVDPQFPIARYVAGLSRSRVPNRLTEHPTSTTSPPGIAAYQDATTCTNPIFAATLPTGTGQELCALARGPRSRELVLFAVIGGVPEGLTKTPSWPAIVGSDPDHYDYRGLDPHMVQSTEPRPMLPPPSEIRGDNGPDPIHGREWTTNGTELQFACTFDLDAPRRCDPSDGACRCSASDPNPPLCSDANSQIRGQAYPTIRPLRVAKGLGDRAVIGSICAAGGYDETLGRLADRLAPRLAR